MAHTTGDWEILGKTGAGHIGVGLKGDHVTDGVAFVNGLRKEAAQNAVLIKSAPKLQEICERAAKCLKALPVEEANKVSLMTVVSDLEAAVAASREFLEVPHGKKRKGES